MERIANGTRAVRVPSIDTSERYASYGTAVGLCEGAGEGNGDRHSPHSSRVALSSSTSVAITPFGPTQQRIFSINAFAEM